MVVKFKFSKIVLCLYPLLFILLACSNDKKILNNTSNITTTGSFNESEESEIKLEDESLSHKIGEYSFKENLKKYLSNDMWKQLNPSEKVYYDLKDEIIQDLAFLKQLDEGLINLFFKSSSLVLDAGHIIQGSTKKQQEVIVYLTSLVGENCLKTLSECSHLRYLVSNYYFRLSLTNAASLNLAQVTETNITNDELEVSTSLLLLALEYNPRNGMDSAIRSLFLKLLSYTDKMKVSPVKKAFQNLIFTRLSSILRIEDLGEGELALIRNYFVKSDLQEVLKKSSSNSSFFSDLYKILKILNISDTFFSNDKILKYFSDDTDLIKKFSEIKLNNLHFLTLFDIDKVDVIFQHEISFWFYLASNNLIDGLELSTVLKNFPEEKKEESFKILHNFIKFNFTVDLIKSFNILGNLFEFYPPTSRDNILKLTENSFSINDIWQKHFLMAGNAKSLADSLDVYKTYRRDVNSSFLDLTDYIENVSKNVHLLLNIPATTLILSSFSKFDGKLEFKVFGFTFIINGSFFASRLLSGLTTSFFNFHKSGGDVVKSAGYQNSQFGIFEDNISSIQLIQSLSFMHQTNIYKFFNTTPKDVLDILTTELLEESKDDFESLTANADKLAKNTSDYFSDFKKQCSYLANYYCTEVSDNKTICDNSKIRKIYPLSRGAINIETRLPDIRHRILLGIPRSDVTMKEQGAAFSIRSAAGIYKRDSFSSDAKLSSSMYGPIDSQLDVINRKYLSQVKLIGLLVELLSKLEQKYDLNYDIDYNNIVEEKIKSRLKEVEDFILVIQNDEAYASVCLDFLFEYEKELSRAIVNIESERAKDIYEIGTNFDNNTTKATLFASNELGEKLYNLSGPRPWISEKYLIKESKLIRPDVSGISKNKYVYNTFDKYFRIAQLIEKGVPVEVVSSDNSVETKKLIPPGFVQILYPYGERYFMSDPVDQSKVKTDRNKFSSVLESSTKQYLLDGFDDSQDFIDQYLEDLFGKIKSQFSWFTYTGAGDTGTRSYLITNLFRYRYYISLNKMSSLYNLGVPSLNLIEQKENNINYFSNETLIQETINFYNNISLSELDKDVYQKIGINTSNPKANKHLAYTFYDIDFETIETGGGRVHYQINYTDRAGPFNQLFDFISSPVYSIGNVIDTSGLYKSAGVDTEFTSIKMIPNSLRKNTIIPLAMAWEFANQCINRKGILINKLFSEIDPVFENYFGFEYNKLWDRTDDLLARVQSIYDEDVKNNTIKYYNYQVSDVEFEREKINFTYIDPLRIEEYTVNKEKYRQRTLNLYNDPNVSCETLNKQARQQRVSL